MLNLWSKLVAKSAKWMHVSGLTKNEVLNIGGYRYPVAEFLGYSDEKITNILKNAGAGPSDIEAAFAAFNEMRKA